MISVSALFIQNTTLRILRGMSILSMGALLVSLINHLIWLLSESLAIKLVAAGIIPIIIYEGILISVILEIGFDTDAVDILELSLFKGTFAISLNLAYLLIIHLLIKLYNSISQIKIPHLHLMPAILLAFE